MMIKNDICLMCGKCCHYYFKGILKRCKHLGKDNKCKIYSRRLGTRIDIGVVCTLRKLSHYDYIDCPYNNGKPILHLLGIDSDIKQLLNDNKIKQNER